jgi:hypothetical protein
MAKDLWNQTEIYKERYGDRCQACAHIEAGKHEHWCAMVGYDVRQKGGCGGCHACQGMHCMIPHPGHDCMSHSWGIPIITVVSDEVPAFTTDKDPADECDMCREWEAWAKSMSKGKHERS